MPSDAQVIFESWSAPIWVNMSLCLAALIYIVGWFRLHTVSPKLIPSWRLAAFLCGIISLWIAIGSPLAAFDDVSLTIHMVQHLLLMTVTPPLILLGAPAIPFLQGLPERMTRRIVAPILRWGWVKWLARFISNPAICWLAAGLALIGWHVPAVFELALRSSAWHEFEHGSFFAAGLLFWWPVVQPWPSTSRWPRWSIPLYLFSATWPCDALSAFLAFCDRVVYPTYLSSPQLLTTSPLQDQECAAALMWVCVTIILLVPAVIAMIQLLSPASPHSQAQTWVELNGIAGRLFDPSKSEVI